LFFVDHPILTPGVTALPRLAGTDSFTEWLFLEREFVQTDRSKTDPIGWLLLDCRLRQPSQSSQRISPVIAHPRNPLPRIARLKHLLDGSPPPRRGGYSK